MSLSDAMRMVPPTPESARLVFGDRTGVAEHFVALLATTGIDHGLIGPREGPRLWDRHVLNCAVVAQLIPPDDGEGRVIDVGSGAGLPGLPIAIARPDLDVRLVEPLARRTLWLEQAVRELSLDNVTIHTARAEDLWGTVHAEWVTARAVTGLVRLAEWSLPLLTCPGSMLALKGSRAADELDEAAERLSKLGVGHAQVLSVGVGVVAEPTTVVRLDLARPLDLRAFRRRHQASSAGSARRRADRRRHAGGQISRFVSPDNAPMTGHA